MHAGVGAVPMQPCNCSETCLCPLRPDAPGTKTESDSRCPLKMRYSLISSLMRRFWLEG